MSMPRSKHEIRRRLCAVAGLLAVVTGSGCYNGDALLEHARSAAQRTRAAEVDLGTYSTTLPKSPETKALTDLELHFFGTVPRVSCPGHRTGRSRPKSIACGMR